MRSGHTVPMETSGLQPEKCGFSVSSGACDASSCTRSCEMSETWHVYPPPQPPLSQTESVPIPLTIMYEFCETRRILKKNKACCLDFKEWHTRRLNISMVSLRWFAPSGFQQSCWLFLQTPRFLLLLLSSIWTHKATFRYQLVIVFHSGGVHKTMIYSFHSSFPGDTPDTSHHALQHPWVRPNVPMYLPHISLFLGNQLWMYNYPTAPPDFRPTQLSCTV